MVLVAIVFEALRLQRPPGPPLSAAHQPIVAIATPPAPDIPRISDQEVLAMFPKGSCAIAEVDGRKQLVFFDQKQADQGFSLDAR